MSTAAKASGAKYVIAIAGATGHIGAPVTTFLASEYSGIFHVRALVRNPASQGAQALAAAGAELHVIDEARPAESFAAALGGADIFVDMVNQTASVAFRDALLDAVFASDVRVFFPSTWGLDRRSDYWAFKYNVWAEKDEFNAKIRARAESTPLKVVEVAVGFFLEMILAVKIFGFDHANNLFTIYGSPAQRVSFTHEHDIARTVAEVSCLALNPSTALSVPNIVRVAGTTVSVDDIARSFEKVRGDGSRIEVKSEDLDTARARAQKELAETGKANLLLLLRLCMAEGQSDMSESNDNELVNPGESVFRWKTAEDVAREPRVYTK